MNKRDLIAEIMKEAHMTEARAEMVYEAFMHVITRTLCRGQNITFPRVGRLHVYSKPMYRGYNIQTGVFDTRPARKYVAFKPSTYLTDRVNSAKTSKTPKL